MSKEKSLDKSQDESVRIAHLTMLQGVITRMGANSFTLKALSAAFGSAAVAVTATADKPSIFYAAAAAVPILIFWLMDAQYLRLEKAYRRLYESVRKDYSVAAYNMNAQPFLDETSGVFRLAFTWSVGFFYFAIILSFGIVIYLIYNEV